MGTQYENIRQITEDLEKGIRDLMNDPDGAYRRWLDVMSRFHDYSLNNTLLILQQKPEAELVAGYQAWKKQFGRQVKKGARSIRILAPSPYKKTVEIPADDPAGLLSEREDAGRERMIRKEILVPAFRIVHVFDVSDTEGRELPVFAPKELTGSVEQYKLLLASLIAACPVPVDFENIQGGAKGYFDLVRNRIAVQWDMGEAQTVKTHVNEMAHQKCHSLKPAPGEINGVGFSRSRKEQEAESVAYTVCRHYGIDTSEYSFAYVAAWAGDSEVRELKDSMNTIRRAASEMIDAIDEKLEERCRENGIRSGSEVVRKSNKYRGEER